jgi:hypothetical protein
VRLLNTVFRAFDKIVDQFHVYKVETVAEVYMAVCGAPTECTNHAILAANAAITMQSTMSKINEKLLSSIGDIGVPVSKYNHLRVFIELFYAAHFNLFNHFSCIRS